LVTRKILDDLFSATYEELRRLAANVRRNERDSALNTTALVNEAWIKLSKSPGFELMSPLHFRNIAARAMRQLLVETARRRDAQRRGGGEAIKVRLDDGPEPAVFSSIEEVLAIHHALDELAEIDTRLSRILELVYFGGFDVPEAAQLLDVSTATVERDLKLARAWLAERLGKRPPEKS
jgi:RNA polymerase sigma factor (TIGR02999 family)